MLMCPQKLAIFADVNIGSDIKLYHWQKPYGHITQKWRNDNVFITSKRRRRRRRRFDVVKTLLLRCEDVIIAF